MESWYYKFFLVLGLAAGFVWPPMGCQSPQSPKDSASSDTAQSATEDLPKIVLIPAGSHHFFWKNIKAGARKEAHKLRYELIWAPPIYENDLASQKRIIQKYAKSGIEGMIVTPADQSKLISVLHKVRNRGLPVVILDSDVNTDIINTFIATDNYTAGQECAKRMAQLLNKRGRVLIIRHTDGNSSTLMREQGFIDGMTRFAPKAEVFVSTHFSGVTIRGAFENTTAQMEFFDELDGIFTPNETTTTGAVRALESMGKEEAYTFVGFDINRTLMDRLEEGSLQGLMVQSPYKMGEKGVRYLDKIIHHEKVPRRIATEAKMVTPQNLPTDSIQNFLIPPDLFEWMN